MARRRDADSARGSRRAAEADRLLARYRAGICNLIPDADRQGHVYDRMTDAELRALAEEAGLVDVVKLLDRAAAELDKLECGA